MDELAAALQASELATFIRRSRWTYPAISAAHLLGIALLLGAILPMDLRLLGLWRRDLRPTLVVGLLRPVAAIGAVLAVTTGLLLFTAQAKDYAALPLFWMKLTLVALGLAHALTHPGVATAPLARQRAAGAVSLAIWPTVLVCGRLLGYL
jgi:hypothetical protein